MIYLSDRNAGRQTDGRTVGRTDGRTDTDRQTDRQTDGQTDRQTNHQGDLITHPVGCNDNDEDIGMNSEENKRY